MITSGSVCGSIIFSMKPSLTQLSDGRFAIKSGCEHNEAVERGFLQMSCRKY